MFWRKPSKETGKETIPSDTRFNFLKSHQVGHITLYTTDQEPKRLRCVSVAETPPQIEVTLKKGDLPPTEKIDIKSGCVIHFETTDSVVCLVNDIEEVKSGRLKVHNVEQVNRLQKRQYFRVDTNVPATSEYKVGDHGQELTRLLSGMVRNLSANGALIELDEPLKALDRIKLHIELPPPQDKKITCIGKVVRLDQKENGGYEVAMHFPEVDDRSRESLIQFCLSEQRKQLRFRVEILHA